MAPTATGFLPVDLIESDDLRGSVNRIYAFATGRAKGTGVARAYAGLWPGLSVTSPPPGSASYDATYRGTVIDEIAITDNILNGTNAPFSGDITMNANFSAGTVSGTAPELSITGTLTNKTITGTVIFRGTDGVFTGLAGGDQIMGAFHGAGADIVFAGGLNGPRNP